MTNDTRARDDRRWHIGIAISIIFGLFGVVMAILNYSSKSAPAGGGQSAPTAAVPESPPHPGKGHGKK